LRFSVLVEHLEDVPDAVLRRDERLHHGHELLTGGGRRAVELLVGFLLALRPVVAVACEQA
jgi:hypothetical protein